MAELTRERAEQLLEMAKQQRDPIGIDWWSLEVLRLSNAAAYAAKMAARARELAYEGRLRWSYDG